VDALGRNFPNNAVTAITSYLGHDQDGRVHDAIYTSFEPMANELKKGKSRTAEKLILFSGVIGGEMRYDVHCIPMSYYL